eukprot:CAMPEP_0119562198 /NCGR_PEP_ID=MMETSP1352-20130426/19707_1 /TAXON_ID=265584 /ORGANISM="Stauroneis constricta, Strain CCMP1120" /LENGTH=482 /DNA_ID=CAMNT_0007610545 /DNA_START=243 /DNA_END=1688 /DNA_ORIENTATION=+
MTSRSPTSEKDEKAIEIEACLNQDPLDLWHLRELSLTRGGLLKGKLRQRAWMKLVGIQDDPSVGNSSDHRYKASVKAKLDRCEHQIKKLERKYASAKQDAGNSGSGSSTGTNNNRLELKEKDLIRRDVGRSVIFRFRSSADSDVGSVSNESETTPSGQSSKGENSSVAPIYASDLLAQVLEAAVAKPLSSGKEGKIHYYQGLHDIAAVILHNMDYDTQKSTQILRRICQSHLRDALRENFGNISWLLSILLMPLVEKVDPNVHYALACCDIDLSNLCLPWMITWFTHDIHNHAVAVRFIDAFIASHPMLPFYLSVAILTHPVLKRDILSVGEMGDPGVMFVTIKALTKSIVPDSAVEEDTRRTVPAQEIIEDAIAIMNRTPPRALLDLVTEESCPRREVLEKAATISMFKAPSSWSMTGLTFMAGRLEGDVVVPNNQTKDVRAKLASGVPCIMNTVQGAQTLCKSRTWGSRRHIFVKRRSIW